MARPLYYSTSPVSVDPSTCGSVSPARKAASVLEPNPGIADKPVITHEVSVKPTYCVTVQQQKVWTCVKSALFYTFKSGTVSTLQQNDSSQPSFKIVSSFGDFYAFSVTLF